MTQMMFQGAFTALITPLRDGAIDHEALRALVERQIEGGINGLVPCGTTGESATMNADERLSVIRTVVDQAQGRVPVIAGTGTNDTAATLSFTRAVAEIDGVQAALVVVPYYNKPSQRMLRDHFRAVADGGNLPVVLYNVPGRTVISATPETVAELAEHEQIVALKDATGDMVYASRLIELLGDASSLSLLSGDDFTTFPFVALGGHGCISVASNIDPTALAALVKSAREGDLKQARALHLKLQALCRFLFSDSNPVPTKAAASLLGWCSAEVRGPLSAATPELLEHARQLLRDRAQLPS